MGGCDLKCRLRGSPNPAKVKNILRPEPPHEMSNQSEARVKPPQSLNIYVFNMRRRSTNMEKSDEISKMFFQAEVGCVWSKRDKVKGER